ncbi:hypothetical protein DPMN_013695, partial [Dreissena polymorpha]
MIGSSDIFLNKTAVPDGYYPGTYSQKSSWLRNSTNMNKLVLVLLLVGCVALLTLPQVTEGGLIEG